MTTKRALDKRFILIIICSALSFFLPLLYIKINAQGRAIVGPTVPDIIIYGSDVTGKDKGFWGIAFGISFQLCCNIIFLASMLINYWAYRRNRVFVLAQGTSLLLACAFPLWLALYTVGILDNSDNIAAYTTTIPHVGILLYLPIVYNVVVVMDRIGEEVERNKTVLEAREVM